VTTTVEWFTRSRSELRPLFELAEDSASVLDEYLPLGRVLVAVEDGDVIGHQLIPSARSEAIELKNMAVVPSRQGAGVGRMLVMTAIERCRVEGWRQMMVATAAADIGNLRFYQRVGFRMLAVERDAFTSMTGYSQPTVIDGIPLRDRVWLSYDLDDGRLAP
jgi:GNAT superfamily N-acetyltransferase